MKLREYGKISALLFAIIHMKPYQFIEALYFGVMFDYSIIKYRVLVR